MPRPTFATVNRSAVRHNYRVLATQVPHSKLIPMLKADGYGHGAAKIADSLNDLAIAYAVATPEEAQQLRVAGIEQPLLLLEGAFDPVDVTFASANNCWLMIHNQQQIEWLLKAKLPAAVRVWLGVDTGMHRLGLAPEELKPAYRALIGSSNVHSAMVVCSHFHSAEQGVQAVADQIELFDAVAADLPAEQSLANSAAIIGLQDCARDWCRPGIALYGASMQSPSELKLQPVMGLHSRVTALRKVPVGDIVGYNGRWRAERDSLIATVPIGYADGYPRHASNGTPVAVHGQRATLVGRVSMDMVTVDVTDVEGVALGSEVELWGEKIPVTEVAEAADTISYQLLTGVSSRVPRRYID